MSLPRVFNMDKFHKFVMLPSVLYRTESFGINEGKNVQNIGSFSFFNYTDKVGVFGKVGHPVQYVIGVDKFGRERGKTFTMSQAHNALVVRDDEADNTGKSLFDFIANHPWCEGSRNGTYVSDGQGGRIQLDVKFRLMNSEEDAKTALEASINRSKAQISASELDPATLVEVAAIGIGAHGEPSKMMRHKVVEWAGRRPSDYFSILNSGDRRIRAVIRKGIADGILQVRGEVIYWNETVLGGNEDAALTFLLDKINGPMLSALEEKVNLQTVEPPEKPKKKKNA